MKPTCLMFATVLFTGALAVSAFAHSDDDATKARPKTDQLGQVLFRASCSPAAQQQFDRALALLHSFYFPETVKAFSAIPDIDPTCAIAYWGIAISQRPNPLVGPFDAATLKRGLEAVEKGKTIGAKTARERDWLAAIEIFYKDYDKIDQDTRTKNYEKAMQALTRKYPQDIETKVFYALALNETALHSDKTYANQLKAIKLLAPIDAKYPHHPGVTHYLIHSYDYPPLAKRGLAAANKYARVAPAAPQDAQLDPDYAAGKQAIEARDWNAAITSLAAVALRDTRNAGQMALAFKHYRRALALNSRHRGAHEYAGEASLLVNDLSKAEEHLAALRKICLIPCEEYEDLHKKITAYRERTGK